MFAAGSLTGPLALALTLANSPFWSESPRCSGAGDNSGLVATPLGSLDSVLAELERAVDDVEISIERRSPDPGARARVEAALDQLRFHPLAVADDGSGIEGKIQRAMLVLAAADPHAATQWIDAVLARRALARPDADGLGLDTLIDDRRKALAARGDGRIGVSCEFRCRVFVDGRELGKGEHQLAAGRHDVWVFAETARGSLAHFEVVEITGSGDRACMFFPGAGGRGLLPTPEQWWEAVDYARRLEWAIDCQDLPNSGFDPQHLVDLLAQAWRHTKVLARNQALRSRRVDAAFTLARATADDRHLDEILRITTLDDSLDLDRQAAEFGSDFERRYMARRDLLREGDQGTIAVRCEGSCVATIDQALVEVAEHRVPVGEHRVIIYDWSASDELLLTVVVEAESKAPIEFGSASSSAPEPRVIIEERPRDPETLEEMPPRTRAMVFGFAGAFTLVGGGVWALAFALGGLNDALDADANPDTICRRGRDAEGINCGLMLGAAGVHVAIAAVMFGMTVKARRAPSRGAKKQALLAPSLTPSSIGLTLSGRF